MSKSRKTDRLLDQSEVTCTAVGGVNSANRRKARHSRSLSISTFEYTLRHEPTGTEVSGRIPYGRYTRKEMKALKESLFSELAQQLEAEVAKKLRTPRRL